MGPTAYSGNLNIIVRELPGAGTGDRCVQTADGVVWRVVDHLPPCGTADVQGYITPDGRVRRTS